MSEVARLRRQIEEEYEAARQGLHGYASVARHDIITARTAKIDEYHGQLCQIVGEKAATEILIEINDAIAPAQKRKDPMYCVKVNGAVAYFGPVQTLAEDAWTKAKANPRNHIEVSVNGVVQAVREPVDENQGKP